jgi:guanylate kinase
VSGTSLREVQRAADMQKIALAELEYKGANNIADATDEATVICLLPPDYDEWMRRLQSREVMSEQEFHNRLQTAKHVLENALQRPTFTFVVNNDVTRAADAIDSLVKNRTRGEEEAETGRDVATQLLKKVEDHLARL